MGTKVSKNDSFNKKSWRKEHFVFLLKVELWRSNFFSTFLYILHPCFLDCFNNIDFCCCIISNQCCQLSKQVHFLVGDDFEDFVSIIDTSIKHSDLKT